MKQSKDMENSAQQNVHIKLSPEFINWYNDPHRIMSFEIEENSYVNCSTQNSKNTKCKDAGNSEEQSIGSGFESDVEDNVRDVRTQNETLTTGKYDESIDDNLPPTVTLLTTPDGGKLYLVGTAHFSVESQNDVSKIIRAVQPHIVMVELCKHRIKALQLDEETLFQQAQNIGIAEIRAAIKRHGVTSGLMFIVLLSMSSHVTKELGMAAGSEFRTAFIEAAKVPKCILHLGDRPFNITMQRAFRSLSFWEKIKCGWKLLSSRDSITKEDVEKCKNPDTLDAVIAELSLQFPALAEVFVNERDLFLTYSLQLACQPRITSKGVIEPTRAVGVVGIGHMPGIIRNWGKVHPNEIQKIMTVPPQALSSKIFAFTIRASFIGALLYVGYKIIPLPSTQTLESIKSSAKGLLKVSVI